METLFLYLLKSSGLIIMFYLAYHFLLRKETFFSLNRYFLLSGLGIALTLPLFYIKKIVWVTTTKVPMLFPPLSYKQIHTNDSFEINWFSVIFGLYLIGLAVLFLKLVLDFKSLKNLLRHQESERQTNFKLIDVAEKIAPFSFFNTIVFNSSLYSTQELQSILEHEKIHSEQHHTLDVLIIRFFSILFWFNPFIWLYQKALLQNLEFIADHKAIQRLSDKKSYQLALLKFTTHENCVALTNHFHQSLIKKRIVMLNKNQSHRRNLLKYTLIIPALMAFVILFQVKVIAQEKPTITISSSIAKEKDLVWVIDKNTTDFKLKQDIEQLKKEHGITLKVSKIKRNANFEITAIKIQYEDQFGNKGSNQVASDHPIAPFSLIKKTDDYGKTNLSLLSGKPNKLSNHKKIAITTKDKESDNFTFSFSDDEDEISTTTRPEIPETPTPPNPASKASPADKPELPAQPNVKIEKKIKVFTEKNGDKPTVYINGKKIDVDLDDLDFSFDPSSFLNLDALDEDIAIQGNAKKGTIIITSKDGKTEINLGKEMERFKEEMEKAKSEMIRAFREREKVTPEIEKAKKEMEKAKAAMEKARIELEKARAEALKQQKI